MMRQVGRTEGSLGIARSNSSRFGGKNYSRSSVLLGHSILESLNLSSLLLLNPSFNHTALMLLKAGPGPRAWASRLASQLQPQGSGHSSGTLLTCCKITLLSSQNLQPRQSRPITSRRSSTGWRKCWMGWCHSLL